MARPADLPRHAQNILNQTFGQLTVLSYVGLRQFSGANHSVWLVQCSCGRIFETRASQLLDKKPRPKTCGDYSKHPPKPATRNAPTCEICGIVPLLPNKHRRTHDPLVIAARFWAKVDKDTCLGEACGCYKGVGHCWPWLGGKNDGYGLFRAENQQIYAHVWTSIQTYGPIPKGLQLDHLCRVRHCVNPDHTERVTHSINMSRADKSNLGKHQLVKTHCPKGHPYDESNTIIRYRLRNGHLWRGRDCRMCRRMSTKT